jgi:hypothetical protein
VLALLLTPHPASSIIQDMDAESTIQYQSDQDVIEEQKINAQWMVQ